MEFSGVDALPQARVVLLPFDKFDVVEGLSVSGPDGRTQQVKTPWGALAYQLAGDEGLAKGRRARSQLYRPCGIPPR